MARRTVVQPFISVIVVAHDAEEHIVRAVESVLSQAYEHVQVVVADCASTDRTLSICTRIAERDIRVDVVACDTPDRAAAFDAALAAARGTNVLFMGQDDWLGSGALQALDELIRAHNLQLAFMSTTIDVEVRNGERASHRLSFAVEPTSSAASFHACAHLFIENGLFSSLRGKVFRRDRIDELGLRMVLCGSQVAFLTAYVAAIERVAVANDAPYHVALLPSEMETFDLATYERQERDHARLLDLVSSWHDTRSNEPVLAVHRLHLRQIIASIERICAMRGISSIERTERVRDIIEAPSTRESVDALGDSPHGLGLMFNSIARKNVAGCCLGARFSSLARVVQLPIAHAADPFYAFA